MEAYVAQWHDDFVGWPCFSWTPETKKNIGSWVAEIRDNGWTLDYGRRPQAVQHFGDDVAVVRPMAEPAPATARVSRRAGPVFVVSLLPEAGC